MAPMADTLTTQRFNTSSARFLQFLVTCKGCGCDIQLPIARVDTRQETNALTGKTTFNASVLPVAIEHVCSPQPPFLDREGVRVSPPPLQHSVSSKQDHLRAVPGAPGSDSNQDHLRPHAFLPQGADLVHCSICGYLDDAGPGFVVHGHGNFHDRHSYVRPQNAGTPIGLSTPPCAECGAPLSAPVHESGDDPLTDIGVAYDRQREFAGYEPGVMTVSMPPLQLDDVNAAIGELLKQALAAREEQLRDVMAQIVAAEAALPVDTCRDVLFALERIVHPATEVHT